MRSLEWLLRNLTSVIIRNLSDSSLDSTLTLDVPIQVEISLLGLDSKYFSLYQSPNLENPDRLVVRSNFSIPISISHFDIIKENNYSDSKVVFSIKSQVSGKYQLLFEQTIDIFTLVDIGGSAVLNSLSVSPLNSIFFMIDNNVFLTRKQYATIISLFPSNQTFIPINLDNSSLGSTAPTTTNDNRNTINDDLEFELKNETLTELSKFLSPQHISNVLQKLEPIHNYYDLKLEVDMAERFANEEEQLEIMDCHFLDNIIHSFSSAPEICEITRNDIKQINEHIKAKWEELQLSRFLVEARQIKLLCELKTIYPICSSSAALNVSSSSTNLLQGSSNANLTQSTSSSSSGNEIFSIRGIELPSDISLQRDDEQVSTALGYIVHLLLLISKYLEIPLKYQPIFMASRSMIRDNVQSTSSSSQYFPLYRKGTDKDKYEKALLWLRKDIEQVLSSRGVTYEYSRDMLYNLNLLFSCELCSYLAI